MFKAFLWGHLKYIGFQTFLYIAIQLWTICILLSFARAVDDEQFLEQQ